MAACYDMPALSGVAEARYGKQSAFTRGTYVRHATRFDIIDSSMLREAAAAFYATMPYDMRADAS